MRLFIRVSVLAAWALAVWAQDTGRLSGSLIDPSEAPVAGAEVALRLAGASATAIETTTGREGLFYFSSLRPGNYDVVVTAAGFRSLTLRVVKIDPGRETALPAQRLELGAVSEVVEVTGTPPLVQTTNAEVSATMTNDRLSRLPLFERSVIGIIHTQPGVNFNGRTMTTINGLRSTYASVTLDGVNVQDNSVRVNGLDFMPNRPYTDQVSEITVITSNAGASVPGGGAHISMVTPSGSNEYHGSLYWWNRNSALAANSWFANRDGIGKTRQNLNQGGFTLGGRLIRDRLFFYTNYETYRLKAADPANRLILTETARRGIFRYRAAGGVVREVNVLQASGQRVDPLIQQLLDRVPTAINNFRAGDSREGSLLNTGGYSFLIRDNTSRDNTTAKLDYYISPRNSVSGSWAWNREQVDRPDQSNDFSLVPKVTNDDARSFLSAAWRWNPRADLTNELRGGFNFSPGSFRTTETLPAYFLGGLPFSYPVNTAEEEVRMTRTFNWQNNVTWIQGRHQMRFGFQAQRVRNNADAFQGVVPSYGLGISPSDPEAGLPPNIFPGISAVDYGAANQLYAALAGLVNSYSQTFNVVSQTSGFVAGAPQHSEYGLDNYALYFEDSWRVRPRLTVTLGVRWDYTPPVDEKQGLALLPVLQSNNPVATLLSNMTLDLAGNAAGRSFWHADRNNLAPHLALAWDPFGKGRTSLRAGYGVFFVNEDDLTALFNSALANAGLQASSLDSDLSARLSALPRIPVPRYRVPRTARENRFDNPTNAHFAPHPYLKTPYVQEWNVGIQHEWRGFVFDGRYVGNHAVAQWRSVDFNQVVIRESGFLDDFLRARNNGRLSLVSRGVFDPRYNAALAGSQPLTVFPRLLGGGLLTNPTVLNLIQRGEPGQLGAIYQINDLNGPVAFYRNPDTLRAVLLSNASHSTYNALQLEVRRSLGGVLAQASYSYSKVLSDAAGTSQIRFEPYLDASNARIERSRAPYDLTHSFKTNWIWELPFGAGKRFHHRRLDRVIGGWSIGGLLSYRSGAPFSILSGRGTLNTASGLNMAVTSQDGRGLDRILGVRVTGDGPYYVAPSAINPADGRGVAADLRDPFQGQIFFHPQPGGLGSLQRRMFNGPWVFDWDASVLKETRLRERHMLALRAEFLSVVNNQTWLVRDQSLDSVNFGRINGTATGPRNIQFALTYRF